MKRLTLNGTTQTLTQWGASLGIDRTTIRKRLQAGLSVAAALNPKDTRGAHMKGRSRSPESMMKLRATWRRKMKHGNNRFVPLGVLNLEGEVAPERHLISDSIVYADPLEILCAMEAVRERIALAATHGRYPHG